MRRWCVTLVAVAALLLSPSASPGWAVAPSCEFKLGFKTLHELIPQIVGDCTEDEHFEQNTGNALQATTQGLLVWREADNWTAFTNGSTTWINGPEGLQSRPNAGHFGWERVPSGLDGTITFEAGERVAGFRIVIDGSAYSQCYFRSAPQRGVVTDGVVNFDEAEINPPPPCSTGVPVRRPSGTDGTITFDKGEPVAGFRIVIAGREYSQCYFRTAPGSGSVTDGVVNFNENEVDPPPPCSS